MLRILTSRLRCNFFRKNIHTSAIKFGEPAWVYRGPPARPSKSVEQYANAVGILMWYWILYHCITQYEHLLVEFPVPETSKWTNEELGVPSDDED